ncbi:MAG TPA: FkbM family methyltransferase [Caulobacteraceae bacterium]
MTDTVVVETPSYGRFIAIRGDLITQQLETFGAHTRNELAMLLSFVRPGDIVLDVGGHIGTFAIPMAMKGARVTAIEANPSTFELLSRNIALNGVEVRAINAAVARAPTRFRVAQMDEDNTGSAELVEDPAGEIRGLPLDDLDLASVDLIKIDIEGMEYDALVSAAGLIGRCRPLVYFEYSRRRVRRRGGSPDQIRDFIRAHGYDVFMNIGERNSANDAFRLMRVGDIDLPGGLADFLLIPRDSPRYPPAAMVAGASSAAMAMVRRRAKNAVKRIRRRLLRA